VRTLRARDLGGRFAGLVSTPCCENLLAPPANPKGVFPAPAPKYLPIQRPSFPSVVRRSRSYHRARKQQSQDKRQPLQNSDSGATKLSVKSFDSL